MRAPEIVIGLIVALFAFLILNLLGLLTKIAAGAAIVGFVIGLLLPL
jgi:membrane associated rhomboid family serine protease